MFWIVSTHQGIDVLIGKVDLKSCSIIFWYENTGNSIYVGTRKITTLYTKQNTFYILHDYYLKFVIDHIS